MYKIINIKKIFYLIIVIFLFNCNNKNSKIVNISVKVDGMDSTEVYLLKIKDNRPEYIDTTKVVKGRFNISTKMEYEDFRLLEFKDIPRKPIIAFIGGGDNIKIITHKDSLGLGKENITGSENHDLYKYLMNVLKETQTQVKKLVDEYQNLNNKENKKRSDEIKEEFNKLNNEKNEAIFHFVEKHTDNVISAWALLYLVQSKDNNKIKELYNSFTDKVKDSEHGINLIKKVNMMTKYLESQKETKQDSIKTKQDSIK